MQFIFITALGEMSSQKQGGDYEPKGPDVDVLCDGQVLLPHRHTDAWLPSCVPASMAI